MSRHKALSRILSLTLLGTAGMAGTALHAQDSGTARLVEQGNYWHAQGRDDLARDTWNKLLRIDPNQPDALYGLAEGAISAHDTDGAKQFLKRLESSHPNDARTIQLRGELAIDNQRGALDSARRAATAGRNVEAVRQYRALFGDRPPPDAIAREYFQALAGTPDGWDEAHKGLQQLADKHPADAGTGLALDQVLTYREPTRREGIRGLAALKGNPAVSAQALAARRQALIWLNAGANDAPLFRAYLADAPNDAEIAARLARLTETKPVASAAPAATVRGFRLLDGGDVDGAERVFRDALVARKDDNDAMAGMGLVRLRQQKFAEAQDYLGRAAKTNPGKWRSALTTATYWNLIQQGQADKAAALASQLTPEQQATLGGVASVRIGQRRARAQRAEQAGDLATAQQQLETAMVEAPNDSWVRLDLARLYRKQGHPEQARSVMNGLLLSQPDAPETLYASALFYAESDDPAAGLAALAKIPAASRSNDMIALQRRLWAQDRAAEAKRLFRARRPGEARALLAQTESDLGGELDRQPALLAIVATAYADVGDTSRAMLLTRRLLTASATPGVDDRLLYASLLLKTGQDAELAAVLRQLQAVTMTPAQQRGVDDLRAAYTLRQTDALIRQKNLERAYEVLSPLLTERPDDPKVIGTLARMYVAAGDQGQALILYRKLLQQSPDDIDTLLAAANAAAATRDMEDAEIYMRRAISQAPDSPDVLAAAGRMYRVAGKNGKAEEYFRAALAAQARLGSRAPGTSSMTADADGALADGGGNPFAGMTGGAATAAARPMDRMLPMAPPDFAGGGPAPPVDSAPAIPEPVALVRTPYPVPDTPATGELPLPPPSRRDTAPVALTSGDPVLDELRELNAVQSSSISAGAVYRTRDGEDGLGKLDDLEVPVEARVDVGNGKLVLGVTPTTLDAGTVDDGYVASSRFGAGPAVALNRSISRSPEPVYELLDEPLNQLLLTSGPANITSFPNFTINQSELDALVALLPADRANTPLGVAADRILGSDYFRSLLADNVASLRVLQGSALRDLTPTQLREQLLAPINQSLKDSGSQTESGVGVSVGYEQNGLRADVGSTPMGFRHTDVVGGVRYAGKLSDDVSYVANISRRPVNDSMLSFAGARDDRSGDDWGAITANGGRFDITDDDGSMGLYGYASWHSMIGRNVPSNQRAEAGGGLYLHLVNRTTEALTAGLNLSLLHYQKNLGYFTYGQGGYFSPQRYVNLSVPLNWNGRSGRFNWLLQASAGIQSFKEDPSDYFPNDSRRQADADRAVAIAELLGIASSRGARAVYPGQTKTGVSYNVAGSAEYQMAPQLFLGGQLEVNNAQDYRQLTGGLYVRYLFDRYGAVPGLRPQPLRSPYSQGY